jgi:hypothetical protein
MADLAWNPFGPSLFTFNTPDAREKARLIRPLSGVWRPERFLA